MPDCSYKEFAKNSKTYSFISCKPNEQGEEIKTENVFQIVALYTQIKEPNSNLLSQSVEVLHLTSDNAKQGSEGNHLIPTTSQEHYQISNLPDTTYISHIGNKEDNTNELTNLDFALLAQQLHLTEDEQNNFRSTEAVDLDDKVFNFMFHNLKSGKVVELPKIDIIEDNNLNKIDCQS